MPLAANTSSNQVSGRSISPFEFRKYKPSELPDPSNYAGATIVLTEEDGTNSRQLYSNGVIWLNVASTNKPQVYDGSQTSKLIQVPGDIPIVDGEVDLDLSKSNGFRVVVPAAGFGRFTVSNLPQGITTLIIELHYSGNGEIVWDRNLIKFFNGGQEPSLTRQVGKMDVLSCSCNGAYLVCVHNPDAA